MKLLKELVFEANKDAEYDRVFKAVAKHCDVKPSEVDSLPEKKKKKFYDTLDQCWDSKENKVPDGCPVDIKQWKYPIYLKGMDILIQQEVH